MKPFIKAIATATFCGILALSACNNAKTITATTNTDSLNYTTVIDGKNVALYTLTNKQGAKVTITNYGGRIVSLWMPDKNNKLTDVVLGYDTIGAYRKKGEPFFGALIGRYGNRIGDENSRLKVKRINYNLTMVKTPCMVVPMVSSAKFGMQNKKVKA